MTTAVTDIPMNVTFTTAPKSYDYDYTHEIAPGKFNPEALTADQQYIIQRAVENGGTLRAVFTPSYHTTYQRDRYLSGMYVAITA